MAPAAIQGSNDAFNGDKIFSSTAPGYVGMFNKSTRPSDILVSLFGKRVPLVLRPRRSLGFGDFEIIGQCYIHVLMEEGQFDIKSSKYEAQWL